MSLCSSIASFLSSSPLDFLYLNTSFMSLKFFWCEAGFSKVVLLKIQILCAGLNFWAKWKRWELQSAVKDSHEVFRSNAQRNVPRICLAFSLYFGSESTHIAWRLECFSISFCIPSCNYWVQKLCCLHGMKCLSGCRKVFIFGRKLLILHLIGRGFRHKTEFK